MAMSKAIALTVSAYFKKQRSALKQSSDEIPEEVTVTLDGVEKRVVNRKKTSWDRLRVNVAQTGSVKSELETEDAFVEEVIKWLSLPPGKHAENFGEPAAKKQRTADPLHAPADKKQRTASVSRSCVVSVRSASHLTVGKKTAFDRESGNQRPARPPSSPADLPPQQNC